VKQQSFALGSILDRLLQTIEDAIALAYKFGKQHLRSIRVALTKRMMETNSIRLAKCGVFTVGIHHYHGLVRQVDRRWNSRDWISSAHSTSASILYRGKAACWIHAHLLTTDTASSLGQRSMDTSRGSAIASMSTYQRPVNVLWMQ
jgi:hypothetical protein